MTDLAELVGAWHKKKGEALLLATVVGTKGSTYRKTGARMLMARTEWLAGSISGGCLEADLLETGWEKTANGPVLVTYDATSDDDILWGFGLGCNGKIEVLLERLSEGGGLLEVLSKSFKTSAPLVVSTNLSRDLGQHRIFLPGENSGPVSKLRQFADSLLGTRKTERAEINGEEFLLEGILPPKPLVIFGAGNDAIPLANGAKQLGWQVTVIDPRLQYATNARFPRAVIVNQPYEEAVKHLPQQPDVAAVVMTHNYLNDLTILRLILPQPLAYVGVLGPRRRADRLITELQREHGLSRKDLEKLHAPIGLNLGAEGAHEIALSILAEVLAVSRSKQGGFMSDTATGCELSA